MADNNDAADKTTTQLGPAVNMDELRPIIRQLLAEEIAAGLTPLVKQVDILTADLANTTRRLDLTRTEMKALDSAYRDTQNRYVDAVNAANQIVGTFKGVQELLDQWIAAAATNGKAIIVLQEEYADIKRDLYGDTSRPHNRSIMGELEKIPALIAGALKTEVLPVITRLDKLQNIVDENKKWIDRQRSIQDAVQKYLGGAFKYTWVRVALAVIGGLGAGATVFDILKAMGGG